MLSYNLEPVKWIKMGQSMLCYQIPGFRKANVCLLQADQGSSTSNVSDPSLFPLKVASIVAAVKSWRDGRARQLSLASALVTCHFWSLYHDQSASPKPKLTAKQSGKCRGAPVISANMTVTFHFAVTVMNVCWIQTVVSATK